MTRAQIIHRIFSSQSFLCTGLDTDITKLPQCLQGTEDAVFTFNKHIVDATAPFSAAYKINTAFYECRGTEGWHDMHRTASYIKNNYPDIFLIADAKRGDIGNTSKMYAAAFLEHLPFDAITVAPYMGADSVQPFLTLPHKWAIILALTSNTGAEDFQLQQLADHEFFLYEKVLQTSIAWGTAENLMFVTGATKASMLGKIRKIAPHHFLLVPGIGAQGGSLDEVVANAWTHDCGLLVNASRSILFADSGIHYAQAAAAEAQRLQKEMQRHISTNTRH